MVRDTIGESGTATVKESDIVRLPQFLRPDLYIKIAAIAGLNQATDDEIQWNDSVAEHVPIVLRSWWFTPIA